MDGSWGCMVCTMTRARVLAPPGAPGDLADELEGALGGAEVGLGERGVGVDDADEADIGEVEALGDHLRAEQELEFALGEPVEDGEVVGGACGPSRSRGGRSRGRVRPNRSASSASTRWMPRPKRMTFSCGRRGSARDGLLGEAVVAAEVAPGGVLPGLEPGAVDDHAGVAGFAAERPAAAWVGQAT
jgi:hypothetical protein